MRVLVSLSSDVLAEQGADHESGFKTWNIKNSSLAVSEITDDSFTLTIEGVSGASKYEIYLYNESGTQLFKKEIVSTEEMITWNVTSSEIGNEITAGSSYKAKVLSYDASGNSTPSKEISFMTKPTISHSNLDGTTVTLTASASNAAKYSFYIYNANGEQVATETKTTTATSASWDVTGLTARTTYKAKVEVYDAANNSNTSDIISFKTGIGDPILGDYVDYSVTVDGVTYDKWRILHFDTNGHMEIVCYNGPDYTLGTENYAESNISLCYDSRYDYANCIQILNNESQAYINSAKYGVSARHLGSNPTSPNDYASISLDYVRYHDYYFGGYRTHESYPYVVQYHPEDDEALEEFVLTPAFETESWYAERGFHTDVNGKVWFRVKTSWANGYDSFGAILYFESGNANDHPYYYSACSVTKALAPVIALDSRVEIVPYSGEGTAESPWELTK